jgi:hypothetical protein
LFAIDKLSAMTPVPIPGNNNLAWGNIFESSSGYGGTNDPFAGTTKGHFSNQGYNAGNYFDRGEAQSPFDQKYSPS